MRIYQTALVLLLATASAGVSRAQTPAPDAAKPVQIDIDFSQAPDLKDWVDKQLRPTLELWYPIITADLPSEGFAAPRHFDVKIESPGSGVAYTSGTHVVVSATWIRNQSARGPLNESVGSVIHEAVHVAQQYGGHRFPGWLTEGIADYIRWWKYEPAEARHAIHATRRNGQPASYRDSYQTTAAFLEYVARNHDHEIVVKLNETGRGGSYMPDLWKRYTGKTVDELWTEFAATLPK